MGKENSSQDWKNFNKESEKMKKLLTVLFSIVFILGFSSAAQSLPITDNLLLNYSFESG